MRVIYVICEGRWTYG